MPFDHYNFAATRIDPQLFSGGPLEEVLSEKAAQMRGSIRKASEQHILNVEPEEWAASLSAEYAVEVPSLLRDRMELIDEGERSVDVSHEHFTRAIEDPSRSAYVPGRRVVLVIPSARTHLDNVGMPVRRRADAPTTYAAPGIVRRRTPARPKAKGSATLRPMEPTLVGELYDHIRSLVRSWGRAIERAPEPWRNANEEALRDALLPMLNSHYEGGATGETFNANGKTDILIRVEDRTVFIAECNWWGGPKAVGEALDQLFSYTTWRDTKLALIFFVPRKDPSKSVVKTREVLERRRGFVAWQSGEGRELQCEFNWPGDNSTRADLAVFFVHLPRE